MLQDEGFGVTQVAQLAQIQNNIENKDLVVLDWRLPDGQGIDFLKSYRKEGGVLPIIMLTAKSDLIDKIVGLETGANDYMTKPFEPKELVARIRVQLRIKPQVKDDQKEKELDGLKVNFVSRIVNYNGKSVELTKLEYNLLELLFKDPERVFSRDEILNKVWGYNNFPTTRTVDTHILQLRQKITHDFFETIRGVGYRFKIL